MLPRRAYLGAELPGDDEAFVDGGVKLAAVGDGHLARGTAHIVVRVVDDVRAGIATGAQHIATAGAHGTDDA